MTDRDPRTDEILQKYIDALNARPGRGMPLFEWVARLPSPREAVIACAAEADFALARLLRCAMQPGTTKELLKNLGLSDGAHERPLSSFSARINLAVALGVISSSFGHILHALRDLRNDCAHIRWDEFAGESKETFEKVKPKLVAHTAWSELRDYVSERPSNTGTADYPAWTGALATDELDWRTAVFIAAWLSGHLESNAQLRAIDGECKGRPGYALQPSFLIGPTKAQRAAAQAADESSKEE